jgi:hypothetical protein
MHTLDKISNKLEEEKISNENNINNLHSTRTQNNYKQEDHKGFISSGLDNQPRSFYLDKNNQNSNNSFVSDQNQNNDIENTLIIEPHNRHHQQQMQQQSNEIHNKTRDSSNQYYMYDAANNLNKSTISYKNEQIKQTYSEQRNEEDDYDDDEDEEDTTTDELTDDTAITKQNLNRFKLKDNSLADFSINTTDTFTDTNFIPISEEVGKRSNNSNIINNNNNNIIINNKPLIIKNNNLPPPTKQSTPNLSYQHHNYQQHQQQVNIGNKMPIDSSKQTNNQLTSLDKFLNNSKTRDDDSELALMNNSSSLLKNKIITSHEAPKAPPLPPPPPSQFFLTPKPLFQVNDSLNTTTINSSLASKSNTNLTNISSLTINNASHTNSPMVTPLTLNKRNVYKVNSDNLLQVAAPPPPPRSTMPSFNNTITENNFNDVEEQLSTSITTLPPKLPPKIIVQKVPNDYNIEDNDSVMSCQLITSTSLLLNRDYVKEAHHIINYKNINNNNSDTNTTNDLIAGPRPKLNNPKSYSSHQSTSTQSSQTQTQNFNTNNYSNNNNNNNNIIMNLKDSSDPSKPPPMETCI